MDMDLDLYRQEIRVSSKLFVRLSVVDLSPEHPERTFVFLHGFGRQALQWESQLHEFFLKNRVNAFEMRAYGLSDKPPAGYDMVCIRWDIETGLNLLYVFTLIGLVGIPLVVPAQLNLYQTILTELSALF